MTNTTSITGSAIDSIGSEYRWIARVALDVAHGKTGAGTLEHALRNVTCEAIRKCIARMPTNGAALTAPRSRKLAIAMLATCIGELRESGYVRAEVV
jgi:hypothetical protein